ncbi:glycosyltransferase family 4 protein [Blastopirellula retiformator]|uniref:Glycogen synthase n=1 Tax=Blastopirellula retiformator TaxID=2527970 RepID=A0A5C5V9L6_9BACT|nr:glycosyltransferase family 4 protein [Blastopirellula retiformator]TWT34567.1 Glycogen synthase [Blastopirellula retiformator]
MKNSPLRVLLFSHSATLTHGGGRSFSELLAELCPQADIEVSVVVPECGPLEQSAKHLGAAVFNFSELVPNVEFSELWWCGSSLDASRRIWDGQRMIDCVGRLADAIGCTFDVVYSNTSVCPWGAFFAAKAGLPHVWHLRELVDRDFGWMFYAGKQFTYAVVESLSEEVIVNSDFLAAAVAPYMPNCSVVPIPNGPLAEGWLEDPPSGVIVGDGPLKLALVGRMNPHKGQLDAVVALAHLRNRHIDCELHLFGEADREYERLLIRRSRRLGISDAVKFRGISDDPRSAFCECHIALVCSHFEAFGRVTVEAMATARPIVAADGGATGDLIDNEETGLLYDVGDSVALADCVQRLSNDPELRSKLATKAREEALGRYSRAKYGRSVEDVLRRAATNKARKTCAQVLGAHLDLVADWIYRSIEHQATIERMKVLERTWSEFFSKVAGRILRGIRP